MVPECVPDAPQVGLFGPMPRRGTPTRSVPGGRLMLKRISGTKWLGAAALGLLLAACSSGGSGSAVTGVALTGSPTAATVSLRDSSAQVRSRTAATQADGSF